MSRNSCLSTLLSCRYGCSMAVKCGRKCILLTSKSRPPELPWYKLDETPPTGRWKRTKQKQPALPHDYHDFIECQKGTTPIRVLDGIFLTNVDFETKSRHSPTAAPRVRMTHLSAANFADSQLRTAKALKETTLPDAFTLIASPFKTTNGANSD